MAVFDKINQALTNSLPQNNNNNQSPGKIENHTGDRLDNSNIEKLQKLGLKSMPEDGQEGLDRMWAKYQESKKNKNNSDAPKKKSRLQTLYKGDN